MDETQRSEEARRRFEELAGGLLQVRPEELRSMKLYCLQRENDGLCLGEVEEADGSLVCPKCGHKYERSWLEERWSQILG